MFIKEVKKLNGSTSIRVVESVRCGKAIKQKILRIVGQAINEDEIAIFKDLAEKIIINIKNEREPILVGFEPKDFHEKQKKIEKIKTNLEKFEIEKARIRQRLVEQKIQDNLLKLEELKKQSIKKWDL
jgi:hypothetical protein